MTGFKFECLHYQQHMACDMQFTGRQIKCPGLYPCRAGSPLQRRGRPWQCCRAASRARRGGWALQRKALAWFLVQLGLNALWSPIFFGLKRPGLAFAEIVLLWLAILGTLLAFWRAHRAAGALLLPYLAWVSFAAVLNFTLWQFNK